MQIVIDIPEELLEAINFKKNNGKLLNPSERAILNGTPLSTDGDLISREETKAVIRKKFPKLEDRTEINAVINSMPSVQPKFKPIAEIKVDTDEIVQKVLDEIQPSGDLISRTDLLNKIFQQAEGRDYYGHNMLNLPYVDLIKSMPTISPTESRWIPVTERLPKPFTLVNATCRSLVDDREDWVIETHYLPIPKEANKNGYSDWGNIPMLNWGDAEVIAWVERIIPEPYKAEPRKEQKNEV